MRLPHTLLHWLLAGSAAAAVIFFTVGLTSFFEYRRDRPPWVRAIHDLGVLLALVHLVGVVVLPPRSDGYVAAGISLYAVGAMIFLSAIEAARRTRLQRSFMDLPLPDRLVTEGAYRFIRHPFYLGYLACAAAAPIAIDSVALGLVAVVMMTITITAAFREERVWLSSPRADEYRAYRRRTGMFVPFL